MKICEIWTLTSRGQELMGNVLLDGTTLSSEYTPGNEEAMADLMQRPNVGVADAVSDSHTQPAEWFNTLPIMYHGTRMWAQFRRNDYPKTNS